MSSYEQNRDIILRCWNEEKSRMSSLELSKMVPFCELFAITDADQEFPKKVGDKEFLNDSIKVNIIYDNDVKETKQITPVFSLLRTQTQQFNNVLINKRGISGINNAKINFYNANLASFEVILQITIVDLKNELSINPLARRLITVNSKWLLFYGWSKNNVPNPSLKENDDLDLTRVNGYNKFLVMTSFYPILNSGDNGETILTVKFFSEDYMSLLSNNVQMQNNAIKKLLTKDIKNKNFPICVEINDSNLSDKEAAIPIIRKIGPKGKEEEKEEIYYYKLGWLLQSLRYVINGNKTTGIINKIVFNKFLKKKEWPILTNEDRKAESGKVVLNNIGDFPIEVSEVDKNLYLAKFSYIEFIKNILAYVSYISGTKILANLKNKVLTIFEADEKLYGNIKEYINSDENQRDESKFLRIDFGANNSLLHNLELGTNLDRNMFFDMDVLLTNDYGKEAVFNVAKSLKDDPNSFLGKLYNESNLQTENNTAPGKNKNNFYNFLNANKLSQEEKVKIYAETLNASDTSVSLILKNYIRDITFTIHGTVDISSFFIVSLKNYVDGIDGLYVVRNVIDDITPKSFHTILECNMI